MTKFHIKERIEFFHEVVKTDSTTNTLKEIVARQVPKLPAESAQYLIDKVPIIQWLPHYHPSWLLTDVISGLTIGVMLIPQGLAYARIATIPIENGLYSSWMPAAICAVMGTSKGELTLHSPFPYLHYMHYIADLWCRFVNWTNFYPWPLDSRDYSKSLIGAL